MPKRRRNTSPPATNPGEARDRADPMCPARPGSGSAAPSAGGGVASATKNKIIKLDDNKEEETVEKEGGGNEENGEVEEEEGQEAEEEEVEGEEEVESPLYYTGVGLETWPECHHCGKPLVLDETSPCMMACANENCELRLM